MKRSVAAVAVALTVGLTGCDGRSEAAPEIEASVLVAESTPAETAPVAPAPSAVDVASSSAAGDQIDGAPIFAALYPGAQADAPATVASGPAGPGGLITFTTDATPETVIAFYRQRAEAAGLAPVMAMNQGEARAYGASARKDNGATLQVVAAPGEGGLTSVQLTWSAGV